jgi:hypothetical protein
MKNVAATTLLSAAAFISTTQFAYAKNPEDAVDPYALAWTIGSHEMRGEPFWVKEQGEVVQARLLPVGLFQTTADILDDGGKLFVPRGTQMVLVSASRKVVCNVNMASSGTAKSRRVCLVDSDSDGNFDQSFSDGKGGDYWMTLEGDLAEEKMSPVGEVTLQAMKPEEMTDAPYISFHYQRILDGGLQIPLTQEGGDMVRFHFKVGREKRREWMVKECRSPEKPSQCASANFPSRLTIAGLELELLERRKEDVLMRVITPFGGQKVKFREINDGYNSGLLLYAN